MSVGLMTLATELDSVSGPRRLESLLRLVEELMLAETQDWLAIMRLVRLEATG